MTASDPQRAAGQRKRAIRFIVCLGIVSMFADITYEGARSVIGPFLHDLGSSATEVGLIAGIGEMLAASLRFFSGRFADRTHSYWTITIVGYSVNLIAVPALALPDTGGSRQSSLPWNGPAKVFAARRATSCCLRRRRLSATAGDSGCMQHSTRQEQ